MKNWKFTSTRSGERETLWKTGRECDKDDRDVGEHVSPCAWEAGFEHGMVIVPVLYAKKEWETGPDRSSLLACAIEMEGIPL